MPSLLRATRVAAAAPNSRTIGGAGTCVPPVEVDDPPLDELDDDEDELLALELDVEPEEPKLLEPLLAEEPDDALLPDEVLLPELP